MSALDLTVRDLIPADRWDAGPKFTARVRHRVEHPESVRHGIFTTQAVSRMRSVDVDVFVPVEAPYLLGETRAPDLGGTLEGLAGYSVLRNDDGQWLLVLAIPIDGPPEEIQ